ncbi:MAG: DUF4214 domain-containing protein [Mastigocoleus sp.]
MKKIITVIAGLGFLVTTTLSEPAQANRRFCVVSEIDRSVVCGREANRYEYQQYDRRYRNRYPDSRQDRYRSRGEVRRRVSRIYRDVLGRRGDREGIRTYTNRVLSGRWSLSRVRKDIARSSEAREKINQIYREVLGRDADSNGLRTYRKRLGNGWSLDKVRREIRNSSEARRRRREI